LNQIEGIHDCFIALTRGGEIAHTWTDLNVADWDVDEVIPNPIQRNTPFKETGVLIYIHESFFNCLIFLLMC
jgi:hypothetical protein